LSETDPPRRPVAITPDDSDFRSRVETGDRGIVEFRVGTIRELDRMAHDLERMSIQIAELNELLRIARAPLYLLRQTDIVVIEILLSLSSLWATAVLWLSPYHFTGINAPYRSAIGLAGYERAWAAFALAAAAMKILGLALVYSRQDKRGSLIPRCIGLAMSGFFWCLMSGTTLIANPDTLFAFSGLLMGLVAWWSVLRLAR
jgi:uncharacterized membrane protein